MKDKIIKTIEAELRQCGSCHTMKHVNNVGICGRCTKEAENEMLEDWELIFDKQDLSCCAYSHLRSGHTQRTQRIKDFIRETLKEIER